MPDHRMCRRLLVAAGLLAALACGGLGAPPPVTPADTAVPATATPTATFEIVSPTAVPLIASLTPIVATLTPDLTPTLAAVPEACDPPAAPEAGWSVYCDPQYGFGLRYPPGEEPADNSQGYARIHLPVQPGTNLGEKYLDIYVTENAPTCEALQAGGYEPGAIPSQALAFNGINFIYQSGADAGAGNYYEWEAYSTLQGSLCVSLNFVLHSTNRMNYENPPPEFDRAAEAAVFPQVVSTFGWFAP